MAEIITKKRPREILPQALDFPVPGKKYDSTLSEVLTALGYIGIRPFEGEDSFEFYTFPRFFSSSESEAARILDKNGRQETIIYPVPGTSNAMIYDFEYDKLGRVTAVESEFVSPRVFLGEIMNVVADRFGEGVRKRFSGLIETSKSRTRMDYVYHVKGSDEYWVYDPKWENIIKSDMS